MIELLLLELFEFYCRDMDSARADATALPSSWGRMMNRGRGGAAFMEKIDLDGGNPPAAPPPEFLSAPGRLPPRNP